MYVRLDDSEHITRWGLTCFMENYKELQHQGVEGVQQLVALSFLIKSNIFVNLTRD